MLADDSREVREKAVNSILKIRDGAALGNGSSRKFIVPTLNYDADHYSKIVDLNHEPIFITDTASDKIIFYQQKKMTVKSYPNHSQSVERAIKLVFNAAYKEFDRRDGFIHANILPGI